MKLFFVQGGMNMEGDGTGTGARLLVVSSILSILF